MGLENLNLSRDAERLRPPEQNPLVVTENLLFHALQELNSYYT